MPIDERYIIDKYLKPLSKGAKGAFNLEDDTAVFNNNINITSSDSFVENIHFFDFLLPKYIALRVLGASFSDLASKGATPFYYSLCLGLPKLKNADEWFKSFTQGLQEFQNKYNVHLIGGDMTGSKSIVISVNVFGFLEKIDTISKRNNANVGDDIYVTNLMGEAYLDFLTLKKHKTIRVSNNKNAYLIPTPRFEFAELIKNFATASCDISDGILLDLERICTSSNVSARIEFNQIPTKKTAKNKTKNNNIDCGYKHIFAIFFIKLFFKPYLLLTKRFNAKITSNISALNKDTKEKTKQIAFGDDYELIFCAKKQDFDKIQTMVKLKNLHITKIGSIINKTKKSIILINKDKEVKIKTTKGFLHRF